MAILKIKDKGVWKEIQAIKGDTGHDVYIGDKSKAPSEAKLIIEPVKGTATGTDIQITDSVNDRVSKLVLDGKSTQETTSGKNLITNQQQDVVKRNGLTFTKQKDGSVIVNGTSTTITWYTMKPKSDYEDGNYYLYVKTTDDNLQFYMDFPIGSNASVSKMVTLSSYNQHDASLKIGSGVTLNNARIYFMLAKSDVEIPYEPAIGITPRPDYPSEIENVKGKNLFNTIFVQGARSNANGKDTIYSNNYIRTQNEIEVEPNTTYNIKSVSSKTLSGGDIHYYDKNGNFIKKEAIGINTVKTTPDDCYYINFQYYLNTGLTPSDAYNTQIEKGSVATRYVPYGNIQIVETGKNLFDKDNVNYIKGYITAKGAVWVDKNDNMNKTFYISIKPNTTYTISKKAEKRFIVTTFSSIPTKTTQGNVSYNNNTGSNCTITTGNNDNYLFVFYYNLNDYILTEQEILDSIMIEKGSTATDYEPYTEEVVNIDLKGNELCSLPNGTKDELIVKNGRAKIVKRIGKVVLDGSENWYMIDGGVTTPIYKYFVNNDDKTTNIAKNSSLLMCNYFEQKNIWGEDNIGINYEGTATTKSIRIRTNITTVDEFKAWLSAHNTTVQYELAEPYEIDLGEVSTLTTYEGTSNITNSEDTNMSIEYDTNKTNLYYQNNGNIIKINEWS